MRKNTMVWLGIRHVGDSATPDDVTHMTVAEAVVRVARFSLDTSMARRFEFILARSENEIRALWGRGVGASDSIMNELDSMLAELDEGLD